jgi:ParB family chromosome partitioning protein
VITRPPSNPVLDNAATLIFAANVRVDARLDAGFVASVREQGVLQPIMAHRDGEGDLVVRFGHRRTLAAIEAGRAQVPVYVLTHPTAGDGAAEGRAEGVGEVERVVEQLAENHHRAGLTAAEDAAAFLQLEAFGLTPSQIAKRTHRSKTDITAGLAVAKSELASKASARWEFLTLEQSAVPAEFAANTQAVTDLVAAAKAGGFAQVTQRLRDDRDDTAAYEAMAAELTAAGTVVIERQGFSYPGARLDNIGIDPADHTACSGHAAFLISRWARAADADEPRPGWAAVYVCLDAEANGHQRASRPARAEGERRQMSEEEKAERARVIEGNKDWRAATTVRRAWLATFAQRKTPPKGVERFVLTCLLAGDHEIRTAMEQRHPRLREALGVPEAEGQQWERGGREIAALIEQMSTATAKRQLVVLAAVLLAAWEDRTSVQTWRHTTPDVQRYLGAMIEWGYDAGPLERGLIDEVTSEAQG